VHNSDHSFIRHVNDGLVVDVSQVTMPGFDVRDSGSDERVFDRGGSHIECIETLSHHGQFSRGHGSTRAIHEPTSVSIKVGNKFLRARAKYKDRDRTDGCFRYKQYGFKSDF
jgi:hypothetical protein